MPDDAGATLSAAASTGEAGGRAGAAARYAATFALYVLAVVTVGALLAWPLWLLLGLAGVGEASFHKLTLRVVQLTALLGAWPLARALGLSAHDALCLRRGPGFLAEFRNGVVLGIAGMLGLALLLMVLGIRVPDETARTELTRIVLLFLVAGIGAVLLSVVEELWFRGGLYGTARAFVGVVAAAVFTCALFALVHYARADIPIPADEVRWWSGLEVMRHAFDRLFVRERLADSLTALFLFGVMLVALRERSGRLALPIGVHAGSVIVVRLLREYTVVDPSSALSWMVGTYDGVMGWLAALWLCGLIAVILGSRRLPGVVAPTTT